jgi:predicted metalloendopeptidase
MRKSLLLIFASAIALSACNTQTNNPATEQKQGTDAGINAAWMDKSVVPGDDFYSYADGGWMKTAEIPADRSSIGGFFIADQLREKNTKALFDDILKSKPTSGNEALIANYYNAYFNTDAIDRAGLAPAKADLDAIAGIADKKQLSAAIGGTIRADTDPLNATNFQTENLFGVFVTQGLNTPGEQLPYLMQGGIGLPEREYYLSADPKMTEIRNKYRAYIGQILQLAGYPDAQAAAGRIMDLETKIA